MHHDDADSALSGRPEPEPVPARREPEPVPAGPVADAPGRAAAAPDATGATGEGEWRRVHRATPLLRFWAAILAVLGALALNGNMAAAASVWGALHEGPWWAFLAFAAVVAIVCAVIWLGSGLWWRATGFQVSAEEVAVKRGVLTNQLRTARFDRVQAVDVVEPLVPRLFSMAAVRVETAGGSDSRIDILYLRKPRAERLREVLLDRVRRASRATPDPGADAASTRPDGAAEPAEPAAPASRGAPGETGDRPAADAGVTGPGDAGAAGRPTRELVAPVPTARALGGAGLSATAIVGALGVVVLLLTPLSWATAVPVLLGAGTAVWGVLNRAWRFRAQVDDVDRTLHLSFGLTERRRQAIPLDRVHAAKISQTPLWRLAGWWRVEVSVAGYGAISSQEEATTVVLPVGSREQALAVFSEVTGMQRDLVERIAAPEGHGPAQFTSPASARWVSPVDRRQQSVTLAEGFAVTHAGRIGRRVAAIAPEHIQELSLSHGPVQQLLGLATVRFDLVPGPVKMSGRDLDLADAERLLEQLRDRRLPVFTAH